MHRVPGHDDHTLRRLSRQASNPLTDYDAVVVAAVHLLGKAIEDPKFEIVRRAEKQSASRTFAGRMIVLQPFTAGTPGFAHGTGMAVT